jgi:hypothetical protein
MFYDTYDGVNFFYGGKKIIKNRTMSVGLSNRKVEFKALMKYGDGQYILYTNFNDTDRS